MFLYIFFHMENINREDESLLPLENYLFPPELK